MSLRAPGQTPSPCFHRTSYRRKNNLKQSVKVKCVYNMWVSAKDVGHKYHCQCEGHLCRSWGRTCLYQDMALMSSSPSCEQRLSHKKSPRSWTSGGSNTHLRWQIKASVKNQSDKTICDPWAVCSRKWRRVGPCEAVRQCPCSGNMVMIDLSIDR